MALKQIKPVKADDERSRQRFLDEARITGGLEHPGIVPVYGIGQNQDGRPFYAMRFIKGETLRDAIDRWHKSKDRDYQSVEFRKLLQHFIVVCHAIGYAHSRRVLHRDLKPANIMLGDFGETLVVDWGLAKILGDGQDDTATYEQPDEVAPDVIRDSRSGTDSRTHTGEQLGTPFFMSPEQTSGRPQDLTSASDVYSLGATLYVLVMGLKSAKRGDARGPQPSQDRPAAARTDAPVAPKALLAICRQAMARSPDDRYSCAVDLASDVERWLADEPVTALRDEWRQRCRRWVRRHQTQVAVVVAMLAATSVAMAIFTVLVSRERNRADQARQLAQSNAELTRDVLDQLFLKIGDDRWSRIPGFSSARIEMVNLAIERYRELAQRQPADYRLRADLALALRRAANLHRMVNQFDRAEPLIHEAAELLTTVVSERPDEPRHHTHLIDCLIDQADLTARVQGPAVAEPVLQRALANCRLARTEFPTSIGVNRAYARTNAELAALHAEMGRDRSAFELAVAATDVYRTLLATPQDRTTKMLAALAWSKYAQIAAALQPVDTNQVNTAFAQANTLARQLESEDRTEPNGRFVLAVVLLEQARWQARQSGAESPNDVVLSESVRLLEEIGAEHRSVGSFQRQLAEAWLVRGNRRFNAGRIQEASLDAQNAIQTLEKLRAESFGAETYRLPMADALILRGRVEHATGDKEAARQFWRAAREQLSETAAKPSRAVNDRLDSIQQLLGR